jgi:hypothetical protein
MMKAISLRAPWWWFVLYAGKHVENRAGVRWARESHRGSVLLHASSWFDAHEVVAEWRTARDMGLLGGVAAPPVNLREFAQHRRGGIVGRATLTTIVQSGFDGHRWRRRGDAERCDLCDERRLSPVEVAKHFLRTRHAPPFVCPKQDPWAEPGAVWLVLDEVKPLPFAPWRGGPSLFNVDAVEYAILAAAYLYDAPIAAASLLDSARELCPAVDRRAPHALAALCARGALHHRDGLYCAPAALDPAA